MTANVTAQKQLSPQQRRAVGELVTSGNVSLTAAAVGVSRKTLHIWLRQDSFRAEVAAAESAALDALQRRLVGLGEAAADALQDALAHPDMRIRLRAADITLERLLQLRQLVDFDARLTALENRNP